MLLMHHFHRDWTYLPIILVTDLINLSCMSVRNCSNSYIPQIQALHAKNGTVNISAQLRRTYGGWTILVWNGWCPLNCMIFHHNIPFGTPHKVKSNVLSSLLRKCGYWMSTLLPWTRALTVLTCVPLWKYLQPISHKRRVFIGQMNCF